MNRRRIFVIGLALMAVVGGGVALLNPRSSPAMRRGVVTHTDGPAARKQYTPQDLLRAILAEEVDPYGDKDALRAVLDGMDKEAQALWMREIADMVAALDPSVHGSLQRRMGFFALDRGHLDAGWSMLKPLLDCKSCPPAARDDALRLLDLYTGNDDLRRSDLTQAVIARANELLVSDSKDVGSLPLVWSAYTRMRQEGRLSESVAMQRLYLERYTGTIPPETLRTSRQTFANDLLELGQRTEARPLLLEVAESNRGTAMNEERANYLVLAARSGSAGEAITLLEGSFATGEAQTPATSLVYLELFQIYRASGDATAAMQAADRYWTARSTFAPLAGATSAAAIGESQAMICYRAAGLAREQGRTSDADMWLRRAIEAAPESQTASPIRQMLERASQR